MTIRLVKNVIFFSLTISYSPGNCKASIPERLLSIYASLYCHPWSCILRINLIEVFNFASVLNDDNTIALSARMLMEVLCANPRVKN